MVAPAMMMSENTAYKATWIKDIARDESIIGNTMDAIYTISAIT